MIFFFPASYLNAIIAGVGDVDVAGPLVHGDPFGRAKMARRRPFSSNGPHVISSFVEHLDAVEPFVCEIPNYIFKKKKNYFHESIKEEEEEERDQNRKKTGRESTGDLTGTFVAIQL